MPQGSQEAPLLLGDSPGLDAERAAKQRLELGL